MENLSTEIKEAEDKFKNFREEIGAFRGDLKEYYAFFVNQCESITNIIQSNQVFNNSEHTDLKKKVNMQDMIITTLRDAVHE